ncbi:MAG: hypothetical protein H0U22_08260 [Geodermatophilaceae bacterium]|jgi:hypothetical protein|nr:hypothetical protein [Geodermatophilaceae bacterium]
MGIRRRLFGTALVVGAVGGVASALTRLAARSGVTDAEIARVLPGDDLVAGAGHVIDRAATILTPVPVLWPWLVQLGKQRAGWYFPRWVELGIPPGRRGLRTIEPSLLNVQVGERVPDWGPGDPQFEVAVVEVEHALVYLSLRQKSRNWTWPDRTDPLPDDVLALSWALVLSPVDDVHTRLHLRLRMRRARERSPLMFLGGLFDWVTVALLFAGLRERVGNAPVADLGSIPS